MLSGYCNKIASKYNISTGLVQKLIPTLRNKEKYVLHKTCIFKQTHHCYVVVVDEMGTDLCCFNMWYSNGHIHEKSHTLQWENVVSKISKN